MIGRHTGQAPRLKEGRKERTRCTRSPAPCWGGALHNGNRETSLYTAFRFTAQCNLNMKISELRGGKRVIRVRPTSGERSASRRSRQRADRAACAGSLAQSDFSTAESAHPQLPRRRQKGTDVVRVATVIRTSPKQGSQDRRATRKEGKNALFALTGTLLGPKSSSAMNRTGAGYRSCRRQLWRNT